MLWPEQNGPYPPLQGDPRAYPSTPATGLPPSQIPQPVRHGQRPAGTQTSPNMNGSQQAAAGRNHPQQKQSQNNQQTPQPRKPRRKPSKLYAIAARRRRLQQEYSNFHHPPGKEDIWICEFCEYESIFGSPPEALIREYEIKDRKERKRLAEKRRLLEKARMKGRKGKKASKKAANNNSNNNQQNQNPPPNRSDPRVDDGEWDGQEDEYYDDEFDDGQPQAPGAGKTCDHPGCQHPPANVKHPGDARGGGGKAVPNGAPA